MSQSSQFKCEVRDLRKAYPGTLALDGVSIGFTGGRVHALLGKNGAGKSTLVKILAGAVTPSGGSIFVDGREVQLHSPQDAFAKGIATVYQELSLIPELSVAENILFGRLPRKGIAIDWKQVYARASELLARLQISLDVRRPVRELGVASQQLVEIAKAMSFDPAVLMLDEPTSSLAHHEAQNLFALIRSLASQGVAIIYISHRLQELQEVADEMSVLRDGHLIGTTSMEGATPATIAHMMFGEVIPGHSPAAVSAEAGNILEVRNLSSAGRFQDVSFSLRKGEVLGIAGMLGSGRSELLLSLFGADPIDSGQIVFNGETVAHPTPQRMTGRGMGLAPEDRKHQGLVQMLSIEENLVMAALDRIGSRGVLSKAKERELVAGNVRDLHIKVSSARLPVSSLSGGNQQKVVIGKWLNTQPRLLLFDEPTRGIDVQAKQQIFQIIRELSGQGISSLFVSSELEELFEVCHRILIMRHGRIVGETRPQEIGMEQLLALCMGESLDAVEA